MRDRALVVALAVCILIELLGLQFVNAGDEVRSPEEIILDAAGVSPVRGAGSWHIPGFLQVGGSTGESPAEADRFDTVVRSAAEGGTCASMVPGENPRQDSEHAETLLRGRVAIIRR
jgi:hypothetical protein